MKLFLDYISKIKFYIILQLFPVMLAEIIFLEKLVSLKQAFNILHQKTSICLVACGVCRCGLWAMREMSRRPNLLWRALKSSGYIGIAPLGGKGVCCLCLKNWDQ